MASDGSVTATSLRAAGITLIVITTLIAGARFTVAFSRLKQFSWDDGFLVAAYVFFLTVSILYLVATPTMFRLERLEEGKIKLYPTVSSDGLFIQKIFFVTTSGLWFTLWCVKFSLLALYRRMMTGLPRYIKIWWFVVVFSFVVLVGAVTSSMLSCSSMHAWFTAGACSTPRDVYAATISLWYAFAVDILTDLMVMFLPIGLIWRLQMPLKQKLGLGALFGLGWVCIVVAIIRVKQLGSTVHDSQPKTTWLALWGIVETAIAVIIGCGPGLYTRAKAAQKSSRDRSHGYVNYSGNTPSRNDNKKSNHMSSNLSSNLRSTNRGGGDEDLDLPLYNTKGRTTTTTVRGGKQIKHWSDAHSSQEELAPVNEMNGGEGITVTKSVTVNAMERDADSVTRWHD